MSNVVDHLWRLNREGAADLCDEHCMAVLRPALTLAQLLGQEVGSWSNIEEAVMESNAVMARLSSDLRVTMVCEGKCGDCEAHVEAA